jgi:maltokinase
MVAYPSYPISSIPLLPAALGRWWSVQFTDDLAAWVVQQRWYAGKSHEPQFRVLDAQPAFGGATRFLIMDDAGSSPALYQVPVALTDTEPGDVIAHTDEGFVVDATRHAGFATGLLAEMGVDTSRVSGSRVFAGEQSNTSIVFYEDGQPTIMLKLFRTLHHGENPDVTVQRALSAAGSPYVPMFHGHLDVEWPDVGRESGFAHGTLAFAQEFLPGAQDGWGVALDAAREGRDFTDAARDLGTAIAGVHGALGAALDTRDQRRVHGSARAAVAAPAAHPR